MEEANLRPPSSTATIDRWPKKAIDVSLSASKVKRIFILKQNGRYGIWMVYNGCTYRPSCWNSAPMGWPKKYSSSLWSRSKAYSDCRIVGESCLAYFQRPRYYGSFQSLL